MSRFYRRIPFEERGGLLPIARYRFPASVVPRSIDVVRVEKWLEFRPSDYATLDEEPPSLFFQFVPDETLIPPESTLLVVPDSIADLELDLEIRAELYFAPKGEFDLPTYYLQHL